VEEPDRFGGSGERQNRLFPRQVLSRDKKEVPMHECQRLSHVPGEFGYYIVIEDLGFKSLVEEVRF
jgi:hypothetical protein